MCSRVVSYFPFTFFFPSLSEKEESFWKFSFPLLYFEREEEENLRETVWKVTVNILSLTMASSESLGMNTIIVHLRGGDFFLITASNHLMTWSCSGCPLHILILPSVIAYVTLDQTWMEVPLRKTPGGRVDNTVGGSHTSESLLNQSHNIVLGVRMQVAVHCSEWNVKPKPWITVAIRENFYMSEGVCSSKT